MAEEIDDLDNEEVLKLEDVNELIHSLSQRDKSLAGNRVKAILDEQVKLRETQILTMDIDGIGTLFELMQLRGERKGILLALTLPESLKETMIELREDLKQEEKDNVEED